MPALLTQPAEAGLLRRYVLLVEPKPEPIAARDILKADYLGPAANALCFVQSKFVGHRLCEDLRRALPGRDVISYDGDLSDEEAAQDRK